MALIRYFPPPDLGSGHYLSESISMLKTYTDDSITDIDDAITYWNIWRYFNDGARLATWTDEQFDDFSLISKRAS